MKKIDLRKYYRKNKKYRKKWLKKRKYRKTKSGRSNWTP